MHFFLNLLWLLSAMLNHWCQNPAPVPRTNYWGKRSLLVAAKGMDHCKNCKVTISVRYVHWSRWHKSKSQLEKHKTKTLENPNMKLIHTPRTMIATWQLSMTVWSVNNGFQEVKLFFYIQENAQRRRERYRQRDRGKRERKGLWINEQVFQRFFIFDKCQIILFSPFAFLFLFFSNGGGGGESFWTPQIYFHLLHSTLIALHIMFVCHTLSCYHAMFCTDTLMVSSDHGHDLKSGFPLFSLVSESQQSQQNAGMSLKSGEFFDTLIIINRKKIAEKHKHCNQTL